MADLVSLKEKVQSYLTESGPISIDSDGDYSVEAGSSRVFVRIRDAADGAISIVSVWAPVLYEVRPSPELWKYLALESDSWIFGHLVAIEDDGGTVSILLGHRLLGDFLDREELNWAVYGIVGAVDDLDDELQAKFGGKRYVDS